MNLLRPALLLAVSALGACSGPLFPEVRPIGSNLSDARSPFEKAYEDGKQQFAAGRNGLAIVAFEKALSIDVLSVAVLNGIGAAFDELDRHDIAQRYYRKALAIEPDAPDTLNNLAVSLAMAGDPQAARVFTQAAELDPQNPIIQENAARAEAPQTAEADAEAYAQAYPTGRPAGDEQSADRPMIYPIGEAKYEVVIPDSRLTGGRTRETGHVGIDVAPLPDLTPVKDAGLNCRCVHPFTEDLFG